MKNHIMIGALTMLSVIFVFSDVALAGRVGSRQVHQQKRIYQGIASGELTPHETFRLGKEQWHIQKNKCVALADGKFTPIERMQLEQKQNCSSRHIYWLKHNDISR